MENEHKCPGLAVDIIIELYKDRTYKDFLGLVLIERRYPPYGWALPGGFVEYGESLEQAAVREAKDETSLEVILLKQLHTYSDPGRDPRRHTVSTVFIAKAYGLPKADDDAKNLKVFSVRDLPELLAFDHSKILQDYFYWRDW